MSSTKCWRHTLDLVTCEFIEGNKLPVWGQELDEVCHHPEIAESNEHRGSPSTTG